MARTPPAPRCATCGHWSESSESGLSLGTGYCQSHEKLTDRGHACDHYLTRQEHLRQQMELARRHLDDLDH